MAYQGTLKKTVRLVAALVVTAVVFAVVGLPLAVIVIGATGAAVCFALVAVAFGKKLS